MRILFIGVIAFLLSACSFGVPAAVERGEPGATVTSELPASLTQTIPTFTPPPSATFVPTTSPDPTSQAALPTATNQPAVLQPTITTAVPAANAVTFPDPGGVEWRVVMSDLVNPIGIANAGDGSERLFILEQAGKIRVFQGDRLLPDPFLDISQKVSCCGERGLLGLAFHPNYPSVGFFYVNYTDLNGDTVIARFQVSEADPNRADPNSERLLLPVAQPYPNHNGGEVTFGPDGFLYLGLGDGGSANDPQGNGQSTGTLLGKILRLDVDHGDPYGIPPDNAFAGGGGLPEIWAYGLRNPWRFSFDRLTGDLYIGDVGQNAWEEIDFLPAGSPAGANFGWDFLEGSHASDGSMPDNDLIGPVAEYSHDLGCSVTGGFVYRGSELPEWQGIYLYGDYCSGTIWGLLRDADGTWQEALLFESGTNITSFGEDESGEIYLVDYAGAVLRLRRRD